MLQQIRRSFAAKLNMYILASLIPLFIISFCIFHHFASRYIEDQAYRRISRQAEEINFRVSSFMLSIEKISENLSGLLPQYARTPNSIFDITRQVVKNNDEIFGCAIAFEPYYFASQGYHFAPYSYMQGDSVVTTQISSSYDYYRKNWYRISKEKNASRWSRPYHELSKHNILTSTYSVPLRTPEGKIIGIFSADLALNWLTALIDSIKPYPDCRTIVINREGRFILDNQDILTEEKNIFDQVSAMPDSTILHIAKKIANGESGNATFFDQDDKAYIFYAPLTGTEWFLATICPYKHIYEKLNRFKLILFITFILFLFLVCLIITSTVWKITKPLQNFAVSAASIAEGNFNTPLPEIHAKDEMWELYNAFAEMQEKLAKYMTNLEKTVAAKEKIDSELRIAHDIQMSMLPKNFQSLPGKNGFDLYAILYPARQVGGDLYDFFIHDDLLYFAIGDVSGKGIPASLLMASTISLLRILSTGNNSPAQIVCSLNNSITEHNETDMFVTFFVGMLNRKTGLLKYCNAGHTQPVITRPDQTVSFLNIQPDLPLGILKDHDYQEYSYQFTDGSGILLYTDGVTDAENENNEFYTKERLLKIVRQNNKYHPKEFLEMILDDIRRHIQTHELSDDLSMLTLIYGGEWNIKK